MLRKFSRHFKKDENGKNREWRDIEEGKIRELWSQVRKDLLALTKEFQYIKISRNALT